MDKQIEKYYDSVNDAEDTRRIASEMFGDFLREYRLSFRLSLREMAKNLEVSAAFLSDLELGKRTLSEKMADKLSLLKIK